MPIAHPSLIINALIGAGLLFLLLLLPALVALVAFASRHKKSSRSALALVGRLASVEEPLTPEGSVLVEGEAWRAHAPSGGPVARGRLNVRVTGASGHLLEVEPVAEVRSHGAAAERLFHN